MAEDEQISGVLGAVGPRLRALRKARGATLAQVSEATGISLSTLSRLESGHRRPTLELLLPLAREYRVPLDELVGAPPTGDPRVYPRPFTRHGQTFVPLTRHLGGLHAYKQILPPGRSADGRAWAGPESGVRPAQGSHEGYEWLYVLAGRLWLTLGEHDLVLAAGEAAEFDTRTPHGFANAGPAPVEWLSLYGSQGERVHVRARPAAPQPTAQHGPGQGESSGGEQADGQGGGQGAPGGRQRDTTRGRGHGDARAAAPESAPSSSRDPASDASSGTNTRTGSGRSGRTRKRNADDGPPGRARTADDSGGGSAAT